MTFYSMSELHSTQANIWETLSKCGEVVITNNGKRTALMLDISNQDPELLLLAIKQAKAMIAVNSMRSKAAAAGYMSD